MPAPRPEEQSPGTAGRELQAGFLRSALRFPDRPALEVSREALSYAELRDRAASVAATLQAVGPPERGLVAIYAYRSVPAFSGVLATLMAGHAYVPLNPTLAVERNRLMLSRAGCTTIVADAQSADDLVEVLVEVEHPVTIIVPDLDDCGELAAQLSGHRVLGAGELEPSASWRPVSSEPSRPAYVLFTSGSTGTPKGVTVRHENVTWLLDTMREHFRLDERDRVSQTHELTFDVSVWDMFVTWEIGACLCCPSQKELISPGRYIRDSRLTVWFSVPSTAILMRRLGQLKPDSYPTLRYSLFVGEALPATVAEAWQSAAPDSVVENLYGPVELTIVCTSYRWNENAASECEAGICPIGPPLRGNEVLVVDSQLREVAPGGEGELLVAGPQVTSGYWRDPERTAAAFISLPDREGTYYRTGDHVRRPVGHAPMTFLGRLDHQIKVRGVRVELGEVEAVLREETGSDSVVAVGWPVTETGADGIVAFVGGGEFDRSAVIARLRARLLPQMVPRELRRLPELPLNGSGKFDRVALRASLQTEQRAVA